MAVLSKFESKVDNINQTTENMRQEFDSKLTQMSTDLKSNAEKTAALEVSVNYAHSTVEGQKEKIVKLETEAKHLKERVDTTQRYTKELKTEMAELKEAMAEKLNEVERRSREYSIRLRGIPAGQITGLTDHRIVVATILVKNNLVGGATEVEVKRAMEIAHPLGKPINGKYNVIARFYARPYRNAVVRATKQLGNKLIGVDKITEDLTKLDADKKRRAFPQMQAAFQNGQKVKFHKGQLVINGQTVEIDT